MSKTDEWTQLAVEAVKASTDRGCGHLRSQCLLGMAQVYATLAVAAATDCQNRLQIGEE